MAPIGSWSNAELLTKGHPLSWQLCRLQPRTLLSTHSRDTRGCRDVLPLRLSRQLHWRFLSQPEQHWSQYGASTKLRNNQAYTTGYPLRNLDAIRVMYKNFLGLSLFATGTGRHKKIRLINKLMGDYGVIFWRGVKLVQTGGLP
jgi:hypothetical protein